MRRSDTSEYEIHDKSKTKSHIQEFRLQCKFSPSLHLQYTTTRVKRTQKLRTLLSVSISLLCSHIHSLLLLFFFLLFITTISQSSWEECQLWHSFLIFDFTFLALSLSLFLSRLCFFYIILLLFIFQLHYGNVIFTNFLCFTAHIQTHHYKLGPLQEIGSWLKLKCAKVCRKKVWDKVDFLKF